jgi:glycerol uptake facilitator-like aquaporin
LQHFADRRDPTLGPVSGAHFNPAVTLAFVCRDELNWRTAMLYAGSQILGGIVGVLAAHAMFDLPLWQVSQTVRSGGGQWFAEFVATLGLVLVIFCCLRAAREAIPYTVGLYITSAYWFTASTSFANPAVTIARSLSDTFAGIAPAGVLAFIASQIAGALCGVLVASLLYRPAAASSA